MARAAAALPAPRVALVRRRTVAKVDSIGFVVRRWIQSPGGEVVERPQLVDVVGDLPDGLGALRPVGLLDAALALSACSWSSAL
jgi:hypothetical protein